MSLDGEVCVECEEKFVQVVFDKCRYKMKGGVNHIEVYAFSGTRWIFDNDELYHRLCNLAFPAKFLADMKRRMESDHNFPGPFIMNWVMTNLDDRYARTWIKAGKMPDTSENSALRMRR